jgi:hypothetical protein
LICYRSHSIREEKEKKEQKKVSFYNGSYSVSHPPLDLLEQVPRPDHICTKHFHLRREREAISREDFGSRERDSRGDPKAPLRRRILRLRGPVILDRQSVLAIWIGRQEVEYNPAMK